LSGHHDKEFCRKTLATLARMSPTSLVVSFALIRRAATLSLRDCLILDYRVANHMMLGPDFYTGVHATLIARQRDNNQPPPAWNPSTIQQAQETVAKYLEPIEGLPDLDLGDTVIDLTDRLTDRWRTHTSNVPH